MNADFSGFIGRVAEGTTLSGLKKVKGVILGVWVSSDDSPRGVNLLIRDAADGSLYQIFFTDNSSYGEKGMVKIGSAL